MNPWLILAVVLAIGAAGVGGYFKGSTDAENRARARYSTELEATIAQHNENAVIDMQAAREAGEREAKARVKTVTITNEVERVIHDKPAAPECRLTADAFSLLRAAVQVANGTDTSPAITVPPTGNPVKPTR